MRLRMIPWIHTRLRQVGQRQWLVHGLLILAMVSPVILLAVASSRNAYQDHTRLALSQQRTIALMAATTFQEKLDRFRDLGVALATRVQFRHAIRQGAWEEAIAIVRRVPLDFPFIDRVFLADPYGTLMADTPALPGVRGQNFAYRDWYQGVSRSWAPYISNAYRRLAAPAYNAVAVAIPITSDDDVPLGILGLQIRLEILVVWTQAMAQGTSGFVYLADRQGMIAAHPAFAPQEDLRDGTSIPAVQKVLGGEAGAGISWNPVDQDEQVVAYQPVAGYGWGAIAAESTRTAFAARDRSMRRYIAGYTVMLLFTGALAAVIIHTMAGRRHAEEAVRTLNEALQRRAAALEVSNQELEAFSSAVSHDLRAPLRSIDGFSQVLLEDYTDKLDAAGQNSLERVQGASQRMTQLIDALLTLSSLTQREVRREPVDLSALATAIAAELQMTQPERQVAFQIAEGVVAEGDARLLRAALENLLGNAYKFTGKRPQARIAFGRTYEQGRLVYFVRDNGAGFDMAYAENLFGAFQRLHGSTDFPGMGIGLATVQRIIRRHGGQVWADGTVDHGATFYFTLS